jgi:hypothetical protein
MSHMKVHIGDPPFCPVKLALIWCLFVDACELIHTWHVGGTISCYNCAEILGATTQNLVAGPIVRPGHFAPGLVYLCTCSAM